MNWTKGSLYKITLSFIGVVLLLFLQQFYNLGKNKRITNDVLINLHREHTLPKGLNFAGELTPVNDFNINESIHEALDDLTQSKESTMQLFLKARQWFPVIEPILNKNGIPEDFKFMPLVESGFSYGTSTKNARGFWQFVPATAANYNLAITPNLDERLNAEWATEAACVYLNDANNQFHNWTLAAASFNLGITGLDNELKKQGATEFYHLKLNNETSYYVIKIIALKALLSDPERFGFPKNLQQLLENKPIFATRKVKIDSNCRSLKVAAATFRIEPDILKQFNPWVLNDKIEYSKKHSLFLLLPSSKYALKDSTLIGF